MTNKKLSPGEVGIPRSSLGEMLAQAREIKSEMSRLLVELEERATGHNIEKLGGWRQDPSGWDARHRPKS